MYYTMYLLRTLFFYTFLLIQLIVGVIQKTKNMLSEFSIFYIYLIGEDVQILIKLYFLGQYNIEPI